MKTKIFCCMSLILIMLGCSKEACPMPNDNQELIPPTNGEDNGNKPLSDAFVYITTNGKYTYISNADNQVGKGETVDISKEYYICKYAVTNAEWCEFIKDTGNSAPKYWDNGNIPVGRENHPVLWVSYDSAVEYCEWLTSNNEGWMFRLPTQAEWEYAAAGKDGYSYPWSDMADVSYKGGVLDSKFNYNGTIAAEVLRNPERMATYNNSKSVRYGEQERVGDIVSINNNGGVRGWVNHSDYTGFIYTDIFKDINNQGGNTCAVDAYEEGVSWCGCYNMAGNCWEWTSTTEVARNGAEKGQEVNIIRGGSWYATASSCKVSYRGEGRKHSGVYNTVGLRVVAERKTKK